MKEEPSVPPPSAKSPKKESIFKDRKAIQYYFDVILPQLSRYPHASKAEWVEILSEQCLAESNFNHALTDVLTYMQQEGLDIELDPREVERDMEKIFRLRFLRRMINAAGLSFLEQDILREEVVKLYRSGGKGEPLAPKKKS